MTIIKDIQIKDENTGVYFSLVLVLAELRHNGLKTPMDDGLNPAQDVIWRFDADTTAPSGWTWEATY